MEIRVQIIKVGNHLYAKPKCINAERACRLVNREYLTTKELKTLELMGFTIVIEEV